MLECTILKPEGMLVLNPDESLSKEDFAGLSASVDTCLADHVRIHGALIHAEAFPGWENFAGLAAHIRFVRNHHQVVCVSRVGSIVRAARSRHCRVGR